MSELTKREQTRLNKMRRRRFRLRCDDLFHEQYGNHKAWCFVEVDDEQ